MCIEAIFIASDEGKLLYYRNYTQSLTQFLMEDFAFSLQTSFLKNNQHIFSTHGAHRLVYLPIENYLLVLVTDNSSNIVEDVESIGRIKEVVVGLMNQKLSEELIFDNYVDLTMAFDEMINLKSRILFSKTQISTLLSFESANEEIQKKLLDERINITMKKTAAEIRQIERSKKVKEMIRDEVNEIDRQVKEMAHEVNVTIDTPKQTAKVVDGKSSVTGTKKGMKLGKSLKDKTQKEKTQKQAPQSEAQFNQKVEEPEEPVKFNPLSDEVKLLLEEKITGQIDTSGNLKKFDLKGSLNLFIENEQVDRFSIQTEKYDELKFLSFKLPPNFDKQAWNNGVITLKPKSAALPKKTVVETLKYNLASNLGSESAPFKINFWFSGNQFSCEIDFNSSQNIFKSLQNVEIKFKKLIAFDFEVSEVENSEYSTNNRYLDWKIPQLNKDASLASIIVNFEENINESSVLPAEIEIDSDNTVFGLKIKSVLSEDKRELKFSFKKLLSAKDFYVEV